MLTQNRLVSLGTLLYPLAWLGRSSPEGHFIPEALHPSPALSLLFSDSFYCKYVRPVEGEPLRGVSTACTAQVCVDDSHLWDPVGPGVPAEGFSLIHCYSLHLPGRVTSMQKQSLIFPCIFKA